MNTINRYRTGLFVLLMTCVMLVMATSFNCNNCVTLFDYGQFATKEAWAAESGTDLWKGVNYTVHSPNGDIYTVGISYSMSFASLGNYIGVALPNFQELTHRVNRYVGGQKVDQDTYYESTTELNQTLAREGRTASYPLTTKVGKVLQYANSINEFLNYSNSYAYSTINAMPLAWTNPFQGIPSVRVWGTHVHHGVRFECTTTNTSAPCI